MSRAATALALAALTLAPRAAVAQLRLRSEVGASLRPTRRLELSVAQRLIVGEGIADSGRWQTLLGASYRLSRHFEVGGGYRLWGEADWDAPELRHRLHVEGTASLRGHHLRASWRLRAQASLRDDNDGARVDPALRNRIALRWRARRWLDLDVAGEVFSTFTGDAPSVIDRGRLEVGATLRVRPFDVGLGYRWDAPLLGDHGEYHSLMVSLTWRWARHPEE